MKVKKENKKRGDHTCLVFYSYLLSSWLTNHESTNIVSCGLSLPWVSIGDDTVLYPCVLEYTTGSCAGLAFQSFLDGTQTGTHFANIKVSH